MARAPDPRIEQAKAMYLKGRKLIEIAKALDLPEGTVRRWKSTHKWESERSDRNSERSVKRKQGAQPGNKNSSGGPPGNKKAVTTGEFETLLFDCLDEEEKRLAESMPDDKHHLLLQEIQLLTVRERRMLKRIESIKQAAAYLDTDITTEGMTLVSIECGDQSIKKKYESKLGQIQAIEEALTRVQARKQRAIESLHKFGFDDVQIELERKRVEMAARAAGEIEDEEEPDDGFLDALKGSGDWKGWKQEDEEEDPDI